MFTRALMSETNPGHILTLRFFKIHFNMIYVLLSEMVSFCHVFSLKFRMNFLPLPCMLHASPTSSSMWQSQQHFNLVVIFVILVFLSPLLYRYILFDILFSNTLNLCSFRRAREHISGTECRLIFKNLDRRKYKRF